MHEPIISIIVPLYNAGQYIKRCVDSILSQTFCDFELILVDDGSKDMSAKICNDYASKDSRVSIIRKVNGGVSSARNSGLECIRGGYFVFIDADDYVVPDYLENLFHEAEDADMIVCGYKSFQQNVQDKNVIKAAYPNKIYDNHNITSLLSEKMNDLPFRTVWSKMFRTSILKENNLYFDKDMIFGEDTKFVLEYMLHAKKIKTISLIGYLYREDHCGNLYRYIMPLKTNIKSMTDIMNLYGLLKKKYSFECQSFEISIRGLFTQCAFLYFQKHNFFSYKGYKDYRHYMENINIYGEGMRFRIVHYFLSNKRFFLLFMFIVYIIPLIDLKNRIKDSIVKAHQNLSHI